MSFAEEHCHCHVSLCVALVLHLGGLNGTLKLTLVIPLRTMDKSSAGNKQGSSGLQAQVQDSPIHHLLSP